MVTLGHIHHGQDRRCVMPACPPAQGFHGQHWFSSLPPSHFPSILSLSCFFPLIHCLAPEYIVHPPSFGRGCLENKHMPISLFLPVLTDPKQCPAGPGEATQPPISFSAGKIRVPNKKVHEGNSHPGSHGGQRGQCRLGLGERTGPLEVSCGVWGKCLPCLSLSLPTTTLGTPPPVFLAES